jgi:hypothetical protein
MQQVVQSLFDAVQQLQNPDQPSVLASIDTKASLLATAPAASWPNAAIVCAEINSIAISTLVSGVWTWRRADGSAL